MVAQIPWACGMKSDETDNNDQHQKDSRMNKFVALISAAALALGLTSPASAQTVAGFALIDADTDQVIGALADGDVLSLDNLPTSSLSVRADTLPATVGSVRFDLDGIVGFRTENVVPYALFGDSISIGGTYAPWSGVPLLGTHSLTATPFSGGGGSGTAGTPLSIGFEIVVSRIKALPWLPLLLDD